MNKKTTVKKIEETIPKLSEITDINGLWLIGYPHETIKSLENTYKLMLKLKKYFIRYHVSLYMPLYGTVGYQMAVEEGGFFNTRNINNSNPNYIPKHLNKDVLVKYHKKMYSIFTDFNTKKNNFISRLAWWIPVKKWRDNFRKKFQ